jgi:hypothetical protein
MVQTRIWSDDDNARLIRFDAANMPREEIAHRLRKTTQQVTAQIGKLRTRQKLRERAQAGSVVGRRCDPGALWTPEEIERVLVLGATARLDEWPAIARAHFPGRTAKACRQQYYVGRAARRARPSSPLREVGAATTAVAPPRVAPAHMPQSITAAVFGDPPPGRSALDQRKCEIRHHTIPSL